MKVGLAVVVVFVLIAGSILTSLGLSLRAVSNSDHRWCATLGLLTSRPVPRPADPKANPSRENAYVFYTNLRTLERQFRCD